MQKNLILAIIIIILMMTGCSSKKNYFIEASKKYNINYKTLRAIAEVESNNYEYVINVNKNHIFKGPHIFDNYFTANMYMDLVLDPTFANYDVGVCQINTFWLDKLGIDNEDLLDRKTNIYIAAKIYKDNLKRCKNNIYCALSMYNTGKKKSKAGYKYAKKVIKARNKLFKEKK